MSSLAHKDLIIPGVVAGWELLEFCPLERDLWLRVVHDKGIYLLRSYHLRGDTGCNLNLYF
jgi:hypothetical protein